MSNTYATPLLLELRASRRLRLLIIISHTAALLVLPLLDIAWWMMLTAGFLVVLSFVVNFRRHVLYRGMRALRWMRWGDADDWELHTTSGLTLRAQLLTDWYAQPWLVMIPLRVDGHGVWHVPVVTDMLDADSFRQLRVRLKLHAGSEHATR